MQQEERSERSRSQILDAALKRFAHRGYGATSVRDIAEEAGLSKGNVYHHFPDKEAIFRALLDQYFQAMSLPEFPFNRALATGTFPENLEELGRAARDTVRDYRDYVALIYVDVVEFEGTHIQKFYGGLGQRYAALFTGGGLQEIRSRLRPGVSPVSALLMTSRIFFNYFSLEILFNVPQPYGKDSMQIVQEIADILRHGIVT